MARKRNLFFSQLPTFLRKVKYIFLALALTLLLAFNQGMLLAAKPSLEQTAQTLTQQGFLQLQKGQAKSALQTWQLAYTAYQNLKNQQGMIGSLINQSLAFQALGSYLNACQTLQQALKLEYSICPSLTQENNIQNFAQLNQALEKQPIQKIQIIGLYNLGTVLRLMGEVDSSAIVLQKAFSMSQFLAEDSTFSHELLLSIANTEFTLYKQAKNQYFLIDEPVAKQKALTLAQSKIYSAFTTYQQLSDNQDKSALQASLNQLKILTELKSLPDLSPITSNLEHEVAHLIKQILNQLNFFENIPTIDYIYSQLNFSHQLVKIIHDVKLIDNHILSIAFSITQEALLRSQKLNNNRAISHSLGILGYIYNESSKLIQAQNYFEQAIALAQSVQAWDIAYEWQWQLGRLYQQNGNLQQAAKAYAAAIDSLDQVRGSILGINPDFQFAFQEKIEPVYHEYIDLLLSQEKPDLEQVIRIDDKLKVAELENFLRCGKLPMFSLIDSNQFANLPPIIYLIKTQDKLEVIVRTSLGELYEHRLPFNLIDDAVNNLLKFTQKKQFVNTQSHDFLSYCQTLYQLIFAPIQTYLPDSGTLIFVLDRYLQNLPMGMLYDGQNYLIQSYSISTDLNSQFSLAKPLNLKQSQVLVAGIFQDSPSLNDPIVPKSLKPLPEIKTELDFYRPINSFSFNLHDIARSHRTIYPRNCRT
ncbi:CHAT domain-containing protein [Nostoc sp. UHCC 0870]|uniref:CHAT domain-containing protein n=1 Tax=Nostoc sp. UHCC 0870 TaxID=2914041 RepID=UPI001EE0B427|nr:CHAT domain-containing protein [Nostoc sp. UHCC 0870]UKP01261.1 CHAT domain-containing protein [Nostoc sp. UHCC 0870]